MQRSRILTAIFALAAGLLNNGSSALAVPWTWTPLNYPGAFWTAPYGISGKHIVGIYGDGNRQHGFHYDGTTWNTLDFPGASSTTILGVSGDSIVGYFGNPTGSDSQGFLYDGSSWTRLNYPGARVTFPWGVDGSNIIGSYAGADGHTHGFLYNGSTWTTLDCPGAVNTDLIGISGNHITGFYSDGITDYWLLYDGVTWSTLLGDPFDLGIGALADNHGGISGSDIVGAYQDDSGSRHGFLWDGSNTTNLDYPADSRYVSTYPKDIDGNQIVGFYFNGSYSQAGFLLTTPEPTTLALLAVGGMAVMRRRR